MSSAHRKRASSQSDSASHLVVIRWLLPQPKLPLLGRSQSEDRASESNHGSGMRVPTGDVSCRGTRELNGQLESTGASLVCMKEAVLVADLQWAM